MNVRLATHAMGTRFEVVLAGDDAGRLRAIGEEAIETIEDWHQRLSLFNPGSLLSHVNRGTPDRPMKVDDEMFELLSLCAEVHAASQGAFDITVAPVMRAWGFHADAGESGPAMDLEDLDAAGACVGADGIELDPEARTVRFRRSGMAIDLGGVGKGHALDAAADVLREHGVTCALLHGGTSTVIAVGSPPEGDGWRIALKAEDSMPTVELRDAAMSVSSPHGRTIDVDGTRLGHIIDPATRSPATGVRLAAAVGPSARLTDAWSTALLVLGDRPTGMPEQLTNLTIQEDGEAGRWTVDGPDREAFSFPECRLTATETRP